MLLNVLGFTGDIEEQSRDFRPEPNPARNELRRTVLVVLREANEPLTSRQITERVMATRGKGLKPGYVTKKWITRVRHVVQRLPLDRTTVEGIQAWRLERRP